MPPGLQQIRTQVAASHAFIYEMVSESRAGWGLCDQGRCDSQFTMKSTAIAGVILIILGIAALVYQGVSSTKKETVLNLGPIHAEADQRHTIPIPPVLGIAAVAGGVVLVVIGARK